MCDISFFTPYPAASATQAFPEAVAISNDRAYTYDAFAQIIMRYKNAFEMQGLSRGNRVLLIGTPSPGYCAALWALFQTGAVACPVNPALPSRTIAELTARLRPACMVRDEITEYTGPFSAPCVFFQALQKHTSTDSPAPRSPMVNAALPATIILTSGSTGTPKAVVHSLSAHVSAARAANANMPLGPGNVWLLSLPLYHVSGLAILFRCALAGATIALPRRGASLEEELARTGATHASLVPTQLIRLLKSDRGTALLRKMKGVLLGGAPMDDALVKRAWKSGIPLVRSYGMTETAAQICATEPGAPLEDLYTSGRPLIPETLRIAKDGSIEVRGPTVFMGYYGEDGEIRKPETKDGWFRTGDRGQLDDNGRLCLAERDDAMFISGGENIYPEEIEQAIELLPEVDKAAVAPMPDPEYGSVPAAFLLMHDALPIQPERLKQALSRTLPRYKIPNVFLPWPEHLQEGIKPDRKALYAELLKGIEH